MKKIATALAALLLSVTAGCASSNDSSGKGPVNLTIWHGQADVDGKAIEKLIGEFNQSHPGIKVHSDQGGATTDTMLPKVTAGLAAGTFPDIAYVYGSWAAEIGRSPKVPNLRRYVDDPSVDWNDFWANSRQTTQADGKVIGFPAAVDNLVVLYNKTLLRKANLAPPTPSWIWDDFRSMAKKLTDSGSQTYGTTWPVNGGEETTWQLWPLLWQNGGHILSPDMKHAQFNTPAGVQALTVVQGLAQDKSVYIDSSPGDKGEKLFLSGRMGLYLQGPWVLPDILASKIDYGIAPLPGTNGDHQTISGPDNWVVFSHNSRRVKAAVTFLTWLTQPQQQLEWMDATGALPTRQSIVKLPGYQDFLKKYPGIQVITDNLANAKQIRPVTTKYPRVSGFVASAITSVLLGRSAPQQALNDAAKQSDAILQVPGQ